MWRLYMAASAVNFEDGRTQIHQILATPSTDDGRTGHAAAPRVRLSQASWRAMVPVS